MSKQVLIMPVPPGTRGVYQIADVTGALVAPVAADNILFSFQWTDLNHFAVLDYLCVSAAVSGAITTAVTTGLELVPVRDFWNAYTGGTQVNTVGVTGHEMKLKSNFDASLVNDIRIANTIPLELPLVPGTEDGVSISQVIFGTGTAVGTTLVSAHVLFDRATNSYPFIMDRSEGFNINMALNGPATGTFRVSVTARWLEVTKQVY